VIKGKPVESLIGIGIVALGAVAYYFTNHFLSKKELSK